jgi:hypothetical protein
VDRISALSASLALYGMSPSDSTAATTTAPDAATAASPAASLSLSSLHLQSQMVTTLFSGTVGTRLDARA